MRRLFLKSPPRSAYFLNGRGVHAEAFLYEQRFPEESADLERPTEVLFLRGPWHSAWAWRSTMDRLAKLGFGSRALKSIPRFGSKLQLGSLAEEVQLIAQVASLSAPPILVAHGLGAFVAQKYLESYPSSGLVLVAPFPPVPEQPARRLCFERFGPKQRPRLAASSGLSWQERASEEPDPCHLIEDAARFGNALNLEPFAHFLNALVVSTESDPVVLEADVSALCSWHDIRSGGDSGTIIRGTGSGGHLTMADPEWEMDGGLSDQVASWIDGSF